ncbi:MAG: hypothetical protein ABR576_15630 [Thermoanaerobaculia bacterium]
MLGIENVAVRTPAVTVTLDGTVATGGFEDVKEMTAPPAGAFADSVTVPVAVAPPTRLVGLTATELSVWPAAGAQRAMSRKRPGGMLRMDHPPNPGRVTLPVGLMCSSVYRVVPKRANSDNFF